MPGLYSRISAIKNPLPAISPLQPEHSIAKFKPGQKVEWKWPPGYVSGTVVESFIETVRREIKGSLITRHGTPANPAYLLLTKKGVNVLKLESELMDGEQKLPKSTKK
jgi:hypothetical protein